MIEVELNMFETLAVAAFALWVGDVVRSQVAILRRFCMPVPVVGGLIVALFTLVMHSAGLLNVIFDDTLKTFFLVVFFTTVGFSTDLKVLLGGGRAVAVLSGMVVALILMQNIVGISVAQLFGLDAIMGLTGGSIAMIGGHGTSAAFGPELENLGVTGATTICTAAATFGLVAGSLIGGPIAKNLIMRYKLKKTTDDDANISVELTTETKIDYADVFNAFLFLAFAMGIGSCLYDLVHNAGVIFPIYMGGMLLGAVLRTGVTLTKRDRLISKQAMENIGGFSLSVFLGIAMSTLKLWELADLALPLAVMLILQVALVAIVAYFVCYPLLGRRYDSVVMVAGFCGFSLGATPNAMANMQAVCDQYGMSVRAFFVVPIVGAIIIDVANSIILTTILNIL